MGDAAPERKPCPLRIVMVTSDINDDIDAGLELEPEPTVVLQGGIYAVRAAARMLGQSVSLSAIEAPDTFAVPRAEVDALVAAAFEAAAQEIASHQDSGVDAIDLQASLLSKIVRALTPSDARAAVRAREEAAVRRALETAASTASRYNVNRGAGSATARAVTTAILALDPAQFIGGNND